MRLKVSVKMHIKVRRESGGKIKKAGGCIKLYCLSRIFISVCVPVFLTFMFFDIMLVSASGYVPRQKCERSYFCLICTLPKLKVYIKLFLTYLILLARTLSGTLFFTCQHLSVERGSCCLDMKICY